MMKKFKLKGLKLTSPRKERKNEATPQSPLSIDSQDDSYCTPDASPSDKTQITPKRRSIFTTLRKKINSGLRRSDDNVRAHTWHDGSSGSGFSGTATLPTAKVSSCKAAPRHVHKPLRPAVSEERLSDRSPDFLRKTHFHRCSDQPCRSRKDSDIFLKHETSHSSKSEDESEKEESQQDEEDKDLLPMDAAEYGHASAPSSNEQSGAMATSSSSDNDTAPPSSGSICEEEPQPTMQATNRSSQQVQQEKSAIERTNRVQSHQLLYDQVRLTKPWSLTDELFILSKYGWYWGPITRVEAEDKLANQPDGAFLVRDSSDERYLLSLSFRSYGRTLHTRIEHCNGVFSFYAQPECEGYKSVVSLIHHSMTDSQTGVFCYSRARTPGAPSFPVRLTKPVSRFTHVRSLQYLCRFVIRQNTRYDHIQKLPLPTSIKGWLEENQY